MSAPRFFMILLLLSAIPTATIDIASAQASVNEETKSPIFDMKFAHAQHEIIVLLIKDGEFNQAWEETQKLLGVSLSGASEEEMMLRSLTIISEKFFQRGRLDLAHQVFEKAAKVIADPTNLSRIYLSQARLYKTQGLNQKAIEAFRKYQELTVK